MNKEIDALYIEIEKKAQKSSFKLLSEQNNAYEPPIGVTEIKNMNNFCSDHNAPNNYSALNNLIAQ